MQRNQASVVDIRYSAPGPKLRGRSSKRLCSYSSLMSPPYERWTNDSKKGQLDNLEGNKLAGKPASQMTHAVEQPSPPVDWRLESLSGLQALQNHRSQLRNAASSQRQHHVAGPERPPVTVAMASATTERR